MIIDQIWIFVMTTVHSSAIPKHAIHLETILDFVDKTVLQFFRFLADDLEFLREAFEFWLAYWERLNMKDSMEARRGARTQDVTNALQTPSFFFLIEKSLFF
jgi:hypothetical protein